MRILFATAALAAVSLVVSPVAAEPLQWGALVEQAENRFGDNTDVRAWNADFFVGSDEIKALWRTQGEYATSEDRFETFENQLRAQVPISDFFDATAGVRLDTPDGRERVYGVLGLRGLAPQWFEVDLDLFLSDRPQLRFEVEYEALLTNRLILTPSVEVGVSLADDEAVGLRAFGPTSEIGARLSYDVVDRIFSPYVGVHYERVFGDTKTLVNSEGEDDEAFFFVTGIRLTY